MPFVKFMTLTTIGTVIWNTVLTILGIIGAPIIINLIAPNKDIGIFNLTVELVRIMFPIMLFTAVAFVFVGFLQSLDEFKIPAIISVVANMIMILYLLIFNNKYGIKGVAIAMLIRLGNTNNSSITCG